MKARSLWMALCLGVSVSMLSACGGGEELGGECTTNADCSAGEICHPRAQVCVQTCETSADCPDTAKNCEVLAGTSPEARICKCQTDALCAGGDATGTSTICSDAFEICVTKCGSDNDCPSGYTCEQSTGQCRASSGAGCTYDSCGAGQNCNLTTGQCESAATCSPASPSPGTCTYGQFCPSSGLCDFVPKPTCQNIQNAGVTFNPASDIGPVIYSVTKEIFAVDAAFCPASAPKRVRVQVDAYRPTGTFPATDAELRTALRYYLTSGALATDVQKPAIQNTTVSNGGLNVTFDANFCVSESFTQFTGALQFAEGNPYCFVVQ